MNITDKARIAAEIKAFHNTDFSDCPPLTEEQLKEFKPSHLRYMAKPIKKTEVRIGADVLVKR
jgi:hypothetical protein